MSQRARWKRNQARFRADNLPDKPHQLCRDCAFRPGSPERANGQLDRIVADLHAAMAAEQRFVPFFCHQDMRIGPGGEYIPVKRHGKTGEPIGHLPCRGWIAHLDGIQAQQRRQETASDQPA
jgi:hypothetical protein